MQKALVVYFSRTGFTKKIAAEITARLGADLDAIEDVRSRAGILGYLRSAREAFQKIAIEIKPGARNPVDYDLVILGTPVWAGHMSSPMRAYLRAHEGQLKRVAVFCTQGGSGADKVFEEIAGVCARTPVATLALNDGEIKRHRYDEKLARFLEPLALQKAADKGRAGEH